MKSVVVHRLGLSLVVSLVSFAFGCGGSDPAPKPPTTTAVTPPPAASPALPAKAPPRADPSLVARKVLFGNPDRTMPKVSRDGKQLAWLAPKGGVMNVWVAPASDTTKAKAITDEKTRPIPGFSWAYDNQHLLYAIDKNGDENAHIYSVDVGSGKAVDLTPMEKIQAQLIDVSERFPTAILVGINDRDPKYHDVWKIDIVSGQKTLVQKNESFAGFVTDDSYKIRMAEKPRPDGGMDLLLPDGKGGFTQFQTIPQEDSLTTGPLGYDKAGTTLYLRDSRGRDTSALTALDAKNQAKVLTEDPRADVAGILSSPTDGKVQAVSFEYDRRTWKVLDKSIQPDLDYLRTVIDGDLDVVSRSKDDKTWTVSYVVSDGPVRFYVYDRTKKQAKFLFSNRPALENVKLTKMHPMSIPTRDGKTLVSYLSLPIGLDASAPPPKPVPMVLLVHGGPWARDTWGLNGMHQWLASRGYAVLSVNFRGSTGFGKSFVNAADKEWAGKMHDDLLDAVDWAVKGRFAQKDKVAIMGGSYGGYATLVGLTFTPDVFACGVDIVGPSNLETLLATIPPYWAPMFELFTKRIGDPRTEDGKKLLAARSPLTRVGAIQRPLLIGQGANDPRVKQAESDQIVKAMKAKNLPVSYVLFPDEGHGFARPENRLAFNAVTEIFLATHLGGTYEPIGSDFEGASITIPEGASQITSVAEALPRK